MNRNSRKWETPLNTPTCTYWKPEREEKHLSKKTLGEMRTKNFPQWMKKILNYVSKKLKKLQIK